MEKGSDVSDAVSANCSQLCKFLVFARGLKRGFVFFVQFLAFLIYFAQFLVFFAHILWSNFPGSKLCRCYFVRFFISGAVGES